MSPKDLTPNCVWHGASQTRRPASGPAKSSAAAIRVAGKAVLCGGPLALREALAIQGLSIHELPDVRS